MPEIILSEEVVNHIKRLTQPLGNFNSFLQSLIQAFSETDSYSRILPNEDPSQQNLTSYFESLQKSKMVTVEIFSDVYYQLNSIRSEYFSFSNLILFMLQECDLLNQTSLGTFFSDDEIRIESLVSVEKILPRTHMIVDSQELISDISTQEDVAGKDLSDPIQLIAQNVSVEVTTDVTTDPIYSFRTQFVIELGKKSHLISCLFTKKKSTIRVITQENNSILFTQDYKLDLSTIKYSLNNLSELSGDQSSSRNGLMRLGEYLGNSDTKYRISPIGTWYLPINFLKESISFSFEPISVSNPLNTLFVFLCSDENFNLYIFPKHKYSVIFTEEEMLRHLSSSKTREEFISAKFKEKNFDQFILVIVDHVSILPLILFAQWEFKIINYGNYKRLRLKYLKPKEFLSTLFNGPEATRKEDQLLYCLIEPSIRRRKKAFTNLLSNSEAREFVNSKLFTEKIQASEFFQNIFLRGSENQFSEFSSTAQFLLQADVEPHIKSNWINGPAIIDHAKNYILRLGQPNYLYQQIRNQEISVTEQYLNGKFDTEASLNLLFFSHFNPKDQDWWQALTGLRIDYLAPEFLQFLSSLPIINYQSSLILTKHHKFPTFGLVSRVLSRAQATNNAPLFTIASSLSLLDEPSRDRKHLLRRIKRILLHAHKQQPQFFWDVLRYYAYISPDDILKDLIKDINRLDEKYLPIMLKIISFQPWILNFVDLSKITNQKMLHNEFRKLDSIDQAHIYFGIPKFIRTVKRLSKHRGITKTVQFFSNYPQISFDDHFGINLTSFIKQNVEKNLEQFQTSLVAVIIDDGLGILYPIPFKKIVSISLYQELLLLLLDGHKINLDLIKNSWNDFTLLKKDIIIEYVILLFSQHDYFEDVRPVKEQVDEHSGFWSGNSKLQLFSSLVDFILTDASAIQIYNISNLANSSWKLIHNLMISSKLQKFPNLHLLQHLKKTSELKLFAHRNLKSEFKSLTNQLAKISFCFQHSWFTSNKGLYFDKLEKNPQESQQEFINQLLQIYNLESTKYLDDKNFPGDFIGLQILQLSPEQRLNLDTNSLVKLSQSLTVGGVVSRSILEGNILPINSLDLSILANSNDENIHLWILKELLPVFDEIGDLRSILIFLNSNNRIIHNEIVARLKDILFSNELDVSILDDLLTTASPAAFEELFDFIVEFSDFKISDDVLWALIQNANFSQSNHAGEFLLKNTQQIILFPFTITLSICKKILYRTTVNRRTKTKTFEMLSKIATNPKDQSLVRDLLMEFAYSTVLRDKETAIYYLTQMGDVN